MIYDCFMFNNEYEVLELRFRLLDQYVNQYIISQGNRTHNGAYREYVDLKQKFPKYASKIVQFGVELPQLRDVASRFDLDNIQRDALSYGLKNVKVQDAVMISDIDEIPDLATWTGDEGVFVQRHSYYYFDTVDPRPWNGTCVVAGGRFHSLFGKITPQDVRNFRDILKPVGYGWHFAWLGDERQKATFSTHTELNLEEVTKRKGVKHPKDEVDLVKTIEQLPKVCWDYPQFFSPKVVQE